MKHPAGASYDLRICGRKSVFTKSIQSFQDLNHAAYFFIVGHDLDAMRMRGSASEDTLHNAFRDLACTLVVLLNEGHVHARFDIFSFRFHGIKVGE